MIFIIQIVVLKCIMYYYWNNVKAGFASALFVDNAYK